MFGFFNSYNLKVEVFLRYYTSDAADSVDPHILMYLFVSEAVQELQYRILSPSTYFRKEN